MDFRRFRVVVAGGTSGIGLATQRLLRSRGADVLVAGRSILVPDDPLAPDHVRCDLRNRSNWDLLHAEALHRFGRCDALVHSVGVLIPGLLDRLSPRDITAVIETNFTSVLHALQVFVPCMSQQGHGTIVVIGSLGGIVPMPYEALYAATKFGIRGLVLSAAPELKEQGISICLLCPGPVYTRMLATEAEDERSAVTFVERPMDPDRVARAVARLLVRPRLEMVLPSHSGLPGRLLGAFPSLFRSSYPLLLLLGRRRLRSLLARWPNPSPAAAAPSTRRIS